MARPTPADIARRRQAIFIGLMASLSEPQAQAGLRLWDASYGQTRPTAIIEFVSELAAQLKLAPKQRHELRMGLYQALLKHDAGREPPPVSLAAESQAAGEPAPVMQTLAPGPPPYAVFHKVASGMLDAVREDSAVAVHDFVHSLEAQSAAGGLRPEEGRILLAWAQSGASLSPLIHAPEDLLARAVHACYVAACEALGPVAADRALVQAVTAAEALPEARQFSPRRFL